MGSGHKKVRGLRRASFLRPGEVVSLECHHGEGSQGTRELDHCPGQGTSPLLQSCHVQNVLIERLSRVPSSVLNKFSSKLILGYKAI